MSRFTRFFDRLSRNDAMRAGRITDAEAERARVRRVYKGIYYI